MSTTSSSMANINPEKVLQYSAIGTLLGVGILFTFLGVKMIKDAQRDSDRSPKKMTVAGSLALAFGLIDIGLTVMLFIKLIASK